MVRRRLLPLLVLALGSGTALADVCPTDTMLTGQEQLAQVTRKTPLYNDQQPDGTPCNQAGKCGTRGYLVAGDSVVIHSQANGWACIGFTAPSGQTVFSRIVPTRVLKPAADAGSWAGSWRFGDNSILLRRNGAKMLARGWAQWPWSMGADAETRARLENAGPNMGNLAGSAPWPAGRNVVLTDGDCRVKLRLLGPYLLAQDNNQCGGLNVSFTGVYRQSSISVSEKDWNALNPKP